MSVDMFERRFRQELEKLPAFVPNDKRDNRVWKVGFPAWHALFSSLTLYGHSTGYRLPSFEHFYQYCKKAYAHPNYKHSEKYRKYFLDPDFEPGMRQRISAWYESGMAELYLYVCLVEAIEDKNKDGIVLYDTRADWKLKADVIVNLSGRCSRISAFFGDENGRFKIEKSRDKIERIRKKNTSESSHWGNKTLNAMPTFEISRTDDSTQVINGIRVFDKKSINELLNILYNDASLENTSFQFKAA